MSDDAPNRFRGRTTVAPEEARTTRDLIWFVFGNDDALRSRQSLLISGAFTRALSSLGVAALFHASR
jgi:hypothetical protein